MSKPFDTVRGIIEKHHADRVDLVQALYEIQDVLGYLSDPILAMVAEGFHISKSDVMGVATFYPHFFLKPRPRYTIRCCSSVVCEICGAAKLREVVRKHLRLKEGETSPDGLFLFRPVECLGACDRAPAIKINEQLFGPLTKEEVPDLLQKIVQSGLPEVSP